MSPEFVLRKKFQALTAEDIDFGSTSDPDRHLWHTPSKTDPDDRICSNGEDFMSIYGVHQATRESIGVCR